MTADLGRRRLFGGSVVQKRLRQNASMTRLLIGWYLCVAFLSYLLGDVLKVPIEAQTWSAIFPAIEVYLNGGSQPLSAAYSWILSVLSFPFCLVVLLIKYDPQLYLTKPGSGLLSVILLLFWSIGMWEVTMDGMQTLVDGSSMWSGLYNSGVLGASVCSFGAFSTYAFILFLLSGFLPKSRLKT